MVVPLSATSLSPPRATLRRPEPAAETGGRKAPAGHRFSHLGEAVRKDLEFLKKGIGKGLSWAGDTLRVPPRVTKAIDDAVWLRNLEDPSSPPPPAPSWPHPWYPGLSCLDLLMADLRALEAYAGYVYALSKMWSKPLPEVYDPQDVADYFNCRPHVLALRLVEVFSSFAFAAIKIRASSIGNLVGPSSNMDDSGNIDNFGMVLKETMLNLGPTFIKVGQSLSTRPDIIGFEISKALSELHDRIPPFPRETAMEIIEEEFGSPVDSVFGYISEEPVAAASFGQVYQGRTVDGFTVAVKVQRPNLRHVVVRDIFLLRLGLGLLQTVAKRKSDLRLYADELGKGLVGELDYSLEASNASRFLEVHSSFTFMRVPKVFRNFSRKRVLTMEWITGDSPTELLSISNATASDLGLAYSEVQKIEAKNRLLDLVSKGVEASLVQLLETGLLHADPHPGNLRYTSSGQIGFLDFGLLCQMEKKHQFAMLASIVHIVNGDWASLVRSLIEMDVVRPGTNILRVTMDLEDALGEVKLENGIPDVKFSKVLGKIWSVALKYHFRMPTYYTLVLRSLASLEGLAVATDPNFKTFEAAYPYVVRKLLTENSAETRRILHSVVLNKRKELRWERLILFLRVGSTRQVLNHLVPSKSQRSLENLPNTTNNTAYLVTRLLLSSDGVVLRKLLMTADGASLIRAMVSKEANFFRQQLCRVIADSLYVWMIRAVGSPIMVSQHNSQFNLGGDTSSVTSMTMYDYQSLLRDRRLRIIFSKTLDSGRKDPILMLKLCWASVVTVGMAFALACHRFVATLAETFAGLLSLAPKRVAISA